MSDLLSAAQLAIRAIDKRPILYTDSIKGEQTCRDDLWAITTAERDAIIAALNTAQSPAAQPNVETHGPDAETWAERGKPPAAQPVACLWVQHGNVVNAFPYPPGDSQVWDHDGYWAAKGFSREPLYRQPDPRIAELEGLLREVVAHWHDIEGNALTYQALIERIAAALKEGA